MLENDVSLFMQRRGRWKRLPCEDSSRLTKNPRIADTSACNRNAINAGFLHHLHAVISTKQIATTQNDPISNMLLDFFQKPHRLGPM